jgi:hypothetical protein
MRALLVLMFLTAGAPAFACTPKLHLTVTAEHSAPVLQTTYTLAHSLTRWITICVMTYMAFMFPFSATWSRLIVRSLECGEVGAKVRMRLSNRVVEIARDLEDQGCLPAEVISHYMAQARTDEEVLPLYAERIRKRLAATPTSFFLRGVEDQTDVNLDAIRLIVDSALETYDADRRDKFAALDTDEAVARLADACGRKL